MRSRISAVLGIAIGSFMLYCTQGAMMSGSLPDGGSRDAKAQTSGSCCTQSAPVFTKLWEGDVTNTQSSPDLAVGAYRQIVVYTASSNCEIQYPLFRPDAATPYGAVTSPTIYGGGLITVLGSHLKIQPYSLYCGSSGKNHVVVAAMALN